MPSSSPQAPHRHNGFSLLELLVVITVLGVVMLFAVPGIHQLRTRSLAAQCLSNLRQSGLGAINYFADHDGHFLPTKFWYSRLSTAEKPGIRDYLGSTSTAKSTSTLYHVDSILTCPQLKADYPQKFPCFLNRCYSLNPFLVAKDINRPDDPEAGDHPGSPKRIQNVPRLSAMWVLTDGGTDPLGTGEFSTVVSIANVNADKILYPHRGRQNVVFLDGHVESLTPHEFKNPASKRDFWGDLRLEN